MKKSIFLFIFIIFLFSGCHRYHNNVHAVIRPAIILKPFIIKPYFKGYYNRHGNHRRH